MKIKTVAAKSSTLFSDLSPGEVFRHADAEEYGDNTYLRTDDLNAECEPTPTNAVDMETGSQVAFNGKEVVVRIRGSFVLEGVAQ